MKKVTALLFLSLFSLSLSAQIWREGQIYLKKGDTLDGWVAQAKDYFWYKPTKTGVREVIKAKQVVGFKQDSSMFVLERVTALKGDFPEKVYDFLEVVEDGPVQLMEYTGKDVYGKSYTQYFVRHEDNPPLRVPIKSGQFKREMSRYFAECGPIKDQISGQKLGYSDIRKIVTMFNQWWIKTDASSE